MVAGERYPPSLHMMTNQQWENDFPLINLQTHHIHASLIRYVHNTVYAPAPAQVFSFFLFFFLLLYLLAVFLLSHSFSLSLTFSACQVIFLSSLLTHTCFVLVVGVYNEPYWAMKKMKGKRGGGGGGGGEALGETKDTL